MDKEAAAFRPQQLRYITVRSDSSDLHSFLEPSAAFCTSVHDALVLVPTKLAFCNNNLQEALTAIMELPDSHLFNSSLLLGIARFSPTVTIKAKIDVVKEIREALTPTQVEIFEKTCFGHWLNVGLKKNSQLLIHTVLACMVEGKANELSFLILAPPLETLTPTKGESETDWWKASLEYFEGKPFQREGDERDFGVVSDGDIAAYMSPGPSYTSPASTAQKSLPLANRRKLHVRRTPLKLKSLMRCYSRKMRCTIPPPASTTMPSVATISVPMTTTKVLKDTKDAAKNTHLDAVTTISVPMTTTEEIREALTPTQVEIFKKTCFGHWLNVGLKKNSQLLIHTVLACMVEGKANELSFLILGKRIHFRRQEFCLVTGLRFGCNMYMKKWVKNLTDNPFRNRIFPHIKANVSVKLGDVIDIFDKMRKRTLVLEDNDAVRICLLVLLQQGFLGHQLSHNVSDDMLKLVEHLSNCWNIFPWGSYIWQYTYSQLRDALPRRKLLHDAKREKGEKIQYTMTGFVWAFMIWILEAIPATHRYVHKQPTEKIPRALS
ncbi:phospholipase-like protein [Tanacetum coccineum]|uniref:Phospholipase-like protein n=1 Tax=Tanacetum coccineum TaxID=301880 RepID=A0ABQ5HGC0_9ASTR